MKEVEVTETVVKKVKKFQAEDGTMFNTYQDCVDYEYAKDLKALTSVESCKELEGNAPFGGGEHMEYHDYHWYKLNSLEDIDKVVAFLGNDTWISEKDIGKWICIEISDGDAWAYDLYDMIDYARKVLDKLGFDMTATKRGEENARQE